MKTEVHKQSIGRLVKILSNFFGTSVAADKANAESRWALIASGNDCYWLWNAILQSSATNGGARHLDRLDFIRKQFKVASGTDPLGWETVTGYNEDILLEWLGVAANPHFQRWEQIRNRLKEFVTANRDTLPALSGKLLQADRAACLLTLKLMPGVSDKYARNLMMDVGHPEFMDGSFALDSRIGRFLEAITGTGHTYSAESNVKWTERDLVGIAHAAGLSAWEMDRLIFENWSNFIGPWEFSTEVRRAQAPKQMRA